MNTPDSMPAPNDCGACGRDRRGHCHAYVASVGYHSWIAPTDAQRIERMRRRRAVRVSQKV